jgi:hypothetical protein
MLTKHPTVMLPMRSHDVDAKPSNCEKTHHNIINTKTFSVSLRVSKIQ